MNNLQMQKRYTKKMKKYVDENYLEMVPDDQIKNDSTVTWYSFTIYIAVFNMKRPEKQRIFTIYIAVFNMKRPEKQRIT